MKIIPIFFFLLCSINMRGQEADSSDFSAFLKPIIDYIIVDKKYIKKEFKEFFNGSVFKLINQKASKKDIILMIGHSEEIVRQIGLNVQLKKDIKQFKFEAKNDSINTIISDIASSHFLTIYKQEFISSGFSGIDIRTLEPLLSKKEAALLLKHPSLAVRGIGIKILVLKKEIEPLISYLSKVGKRKEMVGCSFGCVIESGLIGDFIINSLHWEEKEIYRNQIDSILIFNDNILRAGSRTILELDPKPIHEKRLIELVKNHESIPAIVPLLKLKKKEHIPYCMELLEYEFFKEKTGWNRTFWIPEKTSELYSVFKYIKKEDTNPEYFIYLKDIHEKIMSHPNLNKLPQLSIQALYAAIANYKTNAAFLILTDIKDRGIISQKDFFKIIEESFNRNYSKWVFEHWDSTMVVKAELIDSLVIINYEKTVLLSEKSIRYFLDKNNKTTKYPFGILQQGLFNVLQKDNLENAHNLYLEILNSQNLGLITWTTAGLWKRDYLAEPILNRISIESDYPVLRRLFIAIKEMNNFKTTNEAIELLRSKIRVTDGKKQLPFEEYKSKVEKLINNK